MYNTYIHVCVTCIHMYTCVSATYMYMLLYVHTVNIKYKTNPQYDKR